jgi:hypothetical protein
MLGTGSPSGPGRFIIQHIMPNVALWNVKKKAKTTWGWRNTGLETPNPHTAEAASAIQCLALLSGMSRRN